MAAPAERAVGEVMMPWPAAMAAKAKGKNEECIIFEVGLHSTIWKQIELTRKEGCKRVT